MIKFEEAREIAFTKYWKVGTCNQGFDCWCRTIEPIDKVYYNDGDITETYDIVDAGYMDAKTAQHIVDLHNEALGLKTYTV